MFFFSPHVFPSGGSIPCRCSQNARSGAGEERREAAPDRTEASIGGDRVKVAIFGDIHGNAHALEAVSRDLSQAGVDLKICLGDVVFRGPEPARTLSLLRELECDALIVGNTDQWLFQGFPPGFAAPRERRAMLEAYRSWALARLSESDLEFLRSFAFAHTFTLGAHTVLAVHASARSTEEWFGSSSSDDELAAIFGQETADILVCGHIHTPYARRVDGRWVINTGSVGHPADGDPRASYLVLKSEGKELSIEIRRVAYDVEATVQAAAEDGFPHAETYQEALRSGRTF